MPETHHSLRVECDFDGLADAVSGRCSLYTTAANLPNAFPAPAALGSSAEDSVLKM